MKVDGETRIYAVVADPVHQLRTPELLNPIFASIDANIVAVPFHVAAADIEVAWTAFRRMQNLAGIGVAIPHKQSATALCDRTDSHAQAMGVVSAIRRNDDGTMVGAALDGPGFINGLRAMGHEISGKNALLVGTGGAGTAIAYALMDEGASQLAVSNRTVAKADSLCSSVNAYAQRNFAETAPPDPYGYDIVINATSVGLNREDLLPIDVDRLRSGQLVVDAIAKPPITALLQAAEQKGCTVHSGEHMIREHMKLVAEFVAG